MASQSQAGGKGACLAHTAEPLGRIAAMGYERARWAGGPRAEAVFDQHDRRRDQPDAGSFCRARLDRRKPAATAELSGTQRQTLEFLHRQGCAIYQHTQNETRRVGRQGSFGVASEQIGRALKELDIEWIAAHSPQAKGRIERSFNTAQDRLVKGLRVAKAKTI